MRNRSRLLLTVTSVTAAFCLLISSTPFFIGAVEEKPTTYIASDAISAMQSNGTVAENAVWTYTVKSLVSDSDGYTAKGYWFEPELSVAEPSDTAIAEVLSKRIVANSTDAGMAAEGNTVYAYAGSESGYCGAVTFIAPLSGKLVLGENTEIGIGTAGTKAPFKTLVDNASNRIGIAIYQNDTKLWPAEKEYTLLQSLQKKGSTVRGGGPTKVDFPSIGTVTVKKGDRIRIAVIPVNQEKGHIIMAPKVEYTYVDPVQPEETEALPRYSAAQAVMELQNAGELCGNEIWTYTPKKLVKGDDDISRQTGDWLEPELELGRSDNEGVNALLPKQMNIPGKRSGIASDGSAVYGFAGCSEGYGGALTFVAPLSGSVRLTDPLGIGIGTAGTGDPFWTLHEPKQVGVCIYKNDEKLWPTDQTCELLSGDRWENGALVQPGVKNLSIPDLGELRVTKGDRIRISFDEITLEWGYLKMSPWMEYTAVDEIQPEIENGKKYKAFRDLDEILEKGSFQESCWTLEATACYGNGKGEQYADLAHWFEVDDGITEISDSAVNAVADKWIGTETNVAVTEYQKSALISTGSIGVDMAVSLTFVAPETGKINLSDPAGGQIGTAGIGAPFWTLNETSKVAGVAIYRNNEKLWPADADYFRLQGQWSGDGYHSEYQISTEFPSIKDISVDKGDRIRFCVIPVHGNWNFISLSPQIEYTTITSGTEQPTDPSAQKSLAEYSAVSVLKEALKKKSLDDSIWKIQAITQTDGGSMEAHAPLQLSDIFGIDYPYLYKNFTVLDTNFGVKAFQIPQTSLQFAVDTSDRLMVYCGSETRFPAITFTAPKTGMVRIHSENRKPGFVAYSQWGPFYTLQEPEDPDYGQWIKLEIYRNNNQIWPTSNQTDNCLTPERRSMPFPNVDVQVYEGDIIRFMVSSNNSWQFCNFAPVVDYLSYNNKLRPAGDTAKWKYHDPRTDIVWEDMDDFGNGDSEIAMEESVWENPDEFTDFSVQDEETVQENEGKPHKKTIKKIIKRRRVKKNHTTAIIVIAVCCVAVAALAVVIFFSVRSRKKKHKNMQN